MDQAIFFGLAGWDLLVLGLFAAALVGLAWGRAFSPATLARGPRRDVGWGALEQGVAVVFSALFALPLVWGSVAPQTPTKVMEVVQSLGFFAMWGGVVFLVTRLGRTGQLRLGGVVPRRPMRDVGIAAAGTPIAFILASGFGMVVLMVMALMGQTPPDSGHTILEEMTHPETATSTKIVLTLAAVVIAPITEEFFFRGLLQTALQSVIGYDKRWLSILPVAVFFGVIHLGAVPWAMVPVLVLLGVVFGWVYERTGSLWCAVLVHAGFNASSIALSLLGAG